MDVCILTAGRGTRLGPSRRDVNKGLLPILGKAALSHLIERFPADTRFVVAVGHLASQVEEYLRLAHPGTRVELVHVDPYQGPGSGPGTSALCCRGRLTGPFFLVCSDVYWPKEGAVTEEPRVNSAWTGEVAAEERQEYCNLGVQKGQVVSIHDKTRPSVDCEAWTGMSFVRDPEIFFEGIRQSTDVQGEVQISAGLCALMKKGDLAAVPLSGWLDLGTSARYAKARAALEKSHFEKEGELFFRVGERVLKFFSDPMTVRNRIERTRFRPELFPEILGQGRNIYCYRYVQGRTLYDCPDPAVLGELLAWLASIVWRRPRVEPADFPSQCLAFYRARTQARLVHAESALSDRERGEGKINGAWTPEARTLLEAIPSNVLRGGVAAFIHGDLQMDNIVVSDIPGAARFQLIDWRQDFAGALEYGDLYYDFAKLLASIEVDFRAVARGEFRLSGAGQELEIEVSAMRDWRSRRALVEDAAVHGQGLDLHKLRIMVALVYLNMAGVHIGEQSRFFYHYGRMKLAHALNDGQQSLDPSAAVVGRGSR